MSVRQIFWVNLVVDVLLAVGLVLMAAYSEGTSWGILRNPWVAIPALVAGLRVVQSAIRNIKTDIEAPKSMQPVDVSLFGGDR